MDTFLAGFQGMSLIKYALLGGFFFVVHRCLTLHNYPLLDSDPKVCLSL